MADASPSDKGPNSGNRLGQSTSPYLLQHANNPVHWRPWGPEALAEARETGKPILLSIGYAACHWCHVMAHESFEDAATAAVMNRLFVNIKVDREERPDIDQIYMHALQALGEQGGWPLTMFLTPDAEPVWGGTYFPREAKWGRPSFVDVLESAAAAFRDRPEMVDANRTALLASLKALPERANGADLGPKTLAEAARTVVKVFDPDRGGLRGAPKFPQPTLLEFLARSADRGGPPGAADAALRSLRNMVQGGIYDHVGGGLARYSVDDHWLVPHFEKMLHDNALLLERLSDAWLRTGERLFRLRIEETVDWLFREMATEGAFAASIDADSPGGEGAFYVWRPSEVEAILGPEAARAFCAIYDITEAGNFEGASIPNRLRNLELFDPETEEWLSAQRRSLLEVRDRRPRPARDDKILADWNGLLIAGLARAGAALGKPGYVDRAAATYAFILETMSRNGRLLHAARGDTHIPVSFATDYAAMIRAALALQSATGTAAYLDDALRLIEILDRHYWDDAASAYRLTADDAEALVARPLPLFDESIPSANSLIAISLARLATLTGDDRFGDRSDAILAAHCGTASQVLGRAGLFNALDQRIGAIEIVVVAPDPERAGEILDAVRQSWREAFVLTLVSDPAALPEGHPASAKTAIAGTPTVYVCRGRACSAPVTAPEDVRALLAK